MPYRMQAVDHGLELLLGLDCVKFRLFNGHVIKIDAHIVAAVGLRPYGLKTFADWEATHATVAKLVTGYEQTPPDHGRPLNR
jgi:hypothetical protein